MADETPTSLNFDPSSYKKKKRKDRDPIRIGEHEFRLVDDLSSFQLNVERSLYLQDFIHEDDEERFLAVWEEHRPGGDAPEDEQWPNEMMNDITRELNEVYTAERRATAKTANRRSRRSRR